MSVEIQGIDQLAKLAQSFEDAERSLFTALGDAAAKGSAKLEAQAKQSAMELLPKRNGLAQIVANSVYVSKRGVASYSVETTNKRGIRSINKGYLRHPVFGNRERWVTQRVRKGWWTGPVADAKRAVESEMRLTMERIARKLGQVDH